MIKFDKPTILNGAQLRKELNSQGVKIADKSECVLLDSENYLFLDIKANDETKAAEIVNAHIGIDTSKDYLKIKQSAEAKLTALGLTAEEVASILG